MAVTPEGLLSAAKAMSAGEEEVDWRNATSRAYYAAYHPVGRSRRTLGRTAARAAASTGNSWTN